MTILDVIIIGFALLAAVMGFRSGLLRSLATILGYAVAAPMAVVLTPKLTPFVSAQSEIVFFVVVIALGLAIGAMMRSAASELAGDHISPFDRVAGATLGIIRIWLLAVLMVLVFDQIIPPSRQPAWLKESRLRPYLLAAGRSGLHKLPPDVTATIERMKRTRGL